MIPILIAALLWGTTGTAAHFLPADVSPVATGAATMAIGGALLFGVSARGAAQAIADRRTRSWLTAGVVGVVIYPLAFYSSMHLAGVAIGTVVSLGSAPVFAAAIEYLAERRVVGRRWVFCTLVAVVGMLLLVAGGPGETDAASGTPTGVLLGLIAGFSYALYTDASRHVMAVGHSSGSAMGALFGLGAILLLPVLLVTGAPLLQSGGTVAVTAYLAIGPMFVAYLLFGAGLRRVRTSSATTLTLLEPLVATVLAVAVVGERLDPVGWVGLALVLAGVAVLVAPRRWRRGR
jgi:drug/metabolite transporter, DME family